MMGYPKIVGTVTVKFGNDINTDYIIPAAWLQEAWDKAFFAEHAFEKYDPSFMTKCRANPKGDNVVVAGKNFGCGSSREQAVYAIQYNNVIAVIAESFPDLFFRNSINNGFSAIRVEDTSSFNIGDRVDVDLGSLTVRTAKDESRIFMNEEERDLLAFGGRLRMVKNRLKDRLLASTSTAIR